MPTVTTTPPALLNIARGLLGKHSDALMEFFILDASNIPSAYTGDAGPVFAFHNYNDYGAEPLLWQGVSYQPFPVQVDGYVTTTDGKQPRPTITVGNLGAIAYSGGVFSSLLREFDDLNGATVTRKRTILQFLDEQPTLDNPDGAWRSVHPNATRNPNPNVAFPDDIFYIDRKVTETKTQVQFELATAIDVEGVQLPRRQLCANQCPWIYRSGDGCDYAGPPVQDALGNPLNPITNRGEWNKNTAYNVGDYVFIYVGPGNDTYTTTGDSIFNSTGNTQEYYVAKAAVAAGVYPPNNTAVWTVDLCAKTLTACKARFGAQAPLPFGGFPAISRAPLAS